MALLGPAPAAVLGLASALVDAAAPARARHLPAQQPADLHDVPAARRARARTRSSWPTSTRAATRSRSSASSSLANALNFLMIAGHTRLLRGGSLIEMFRTVFVPVLPWEIASAVMTAMAVYGFEVYGAGDHRPVRARARRLPAAAARAAGGPGALGGDRAPDRPARRPPRGHARAAARDARAARPERRPPRRRRRPLRARARPRGRACPSASRRSSTPPACCTTSARRRCPTTS